MGAQKSYQGVHCVLLSCSASFNQVILKFPIIRAAFTSIRAVFNLYDTDGNGVIDFEELRHAMEGLGASLEEKEIHEMFEVRLPSVRALQCGAARQGGVVKKRPCFENRRV